MHYSFTFVTRSAIDLIHAWRSNYFVPKFYYWLEVYRDTVTSQRPFVIQAIFLIIGLAVLVRLFFMQVIDSTYEERAFNNVVRQETIYPSRGLIVDRNKSLLVNNEPVYELVMIPKQTEVIDTLKLCKLLGITKDDFGNNIERVKADRGYSPYKPQVLIKQIPQDIYARLQEYLYQFPGYYAQVRTIRNYLTPNAAHILGYIGEVNQQQISDSNSYYRMGDYIGINGIEKTYEEILRGERGVRNLLVDVHNRAIGTYRNGELDREALAGDNLMITIDAELQAYAEQLMQNKKGSVVAIEPSTGEILLLVSSPSYNPNLLTGRYRGNNMSALTSDTLKPLFNRALMANYPPGSTFKPLMALLALQDTVISTNYSYACTGAYWLGRLSIGCHGHGYCYNVQDAIKYSCNSYFCHIFKLFIEQDRYNNVTQGLTSWDNYLNQFLLGVPTQIDLPVQREGYVPAPARYDKMYGEKRWRARTIISLGIGQGELGVTPLQMAHMISVIANRGKYHYPHVVRHANGLYAEEQRVPIEARHFEPVVEGLERVVLAGTATVANVPGLQICGKTGTAQNPHGKDHSMFVAFAPKNNPKIAMAVVVENSGYGNKYAAPIASLLIEKYLNDSIAEPRKYLEKRMMEADLIGLTKNTHLDFSTESEIESGE